MPENSLPFTQEEHQQLADELRVTEARLRQLCDLTLSVYGANHRVSFSFQKLLDAAARLRSDLQMQWSRDYPSYQGDGPYE